MTPLAVCTLGAFLSENHCSTAKDKLPTENRPTPVWQIVLESSVATSTLTAHVNQSAGLQAEHRAQLEKRKLVLRPLNMYAQKARTLYTLAYIDQGYPLFPTAVRLTRAQ